MPSLSKDPITLHGGCFCSAIRYTISIPAFESRPIIPSATDHPIGPQDEVTARLPQISFDHCNSCRRTAGTVLQVWMIIPQSWIQFSLLPKTKSRAEAQPERLELPVLDVISSSPSSSEDTYVSKFASSEGVTRTFCSRCGTHLTFKYERLTGTAKLAKEKGIEWEPHFDVTLGSLDRGSVEMEGVRPSADDFGDDGVSWMVKWLGKEVVA